jgi:hypothetical protein
MTPGRSSAIACTFVRVSHIPASTGMLPRVRAASTPTVGPSSPSIGPRSMKISPGGGAGLRCSRSSMSRKSRRETTRLSLRPEVPEVVKIPIPVSRGLHV